MANFFQLFTAGRSGKDEKRSLENPSTSISGWLSNLFNRSNDSGISVNMDNAIRLVAVNACTKIIAESLASLQVEVLEERNGITKPAVNHPVYKLFQDPSPYYSLFTIIETFVTHQVINGNGLLRIIDNPDGSIRELRILDTRKSSEPVEYKGRIVYPHDGKNYLAEEIIHVPNLSFDGIWGMGLIQTATENIGIGIRANSYAAKILNNGGSLKGILTHPAQIGDPARERIQRGWKAMTTGSQSGGTVVLEEGMDFKPIDMSPTDMRLLELMQYQLEEMARITRVPLHLLQSLERSTNNNIEQQSIDFVMHTLRPYCKRIEAELNRKLFTKNERGKYFIRFNVDSLLRGDSKARSEYLSKLYSIGVLSPNDIRKILKMNPIEGGDVYLHQGAMITVDQILQNANTNEKEQFTA